jgi:hypothetical protein
VLADDERDLGGVRGHEDRRLSGRVAAADDGHRVPARSSASACDAA